MNVFIRAAIIVHSSEWEDFDAFEMCSNFFYIWQFMTFILVISYFINILMHGLTCIQNLNVFYLTIYFFFYVMELLYSRYVL